MQRFKTGIKKLFLKATGAVGYLKPAAECSYEWYGNHYGGFYVCPSLLNKDSIVYSFGIGEDISFDKAVIERHGCSVFGFDPTPKSIKWIKDQNLPANFFFHEYGIGADTGSAKFYLPMNPDHVSGSAANQKNVSIDKYVTVQLKSLEHIAKELGHKRIDLLKMDIEGSEYDVFENILNTKITINQILVEFHDRFFEDGRSKSRKVVKKLKENGYEIFGVSDSFEEVSFVRIDSISVSHSTAEK